MTSDRCQAPKGSPPPMDHSRWRLCMASCADGRHPASPLHIFNSSPRPGTADSRTSRAHPACFALILSLTCARSRARIYPDYSGYNSDREAVRTTALPVLGILGFCISRCSAGMRGRVRLLEFKPTSLPYEPSNGRSCSTDVCCPFVLTLAPGSFRCR